MRADAGGDAWANQHRQELGHHYLMQDFDAVMGHVAFAQNSAEQLFCEYVPDRWENRASLIRQFGVVALFDRKRTEDAARQSTVSTAFYLYLARTIAASQPFAPKFFYVCGARSPWLMSELDIETGYECARYTLDSGQWKELWAICGLHSLRDELTQWTQPARSSFGGQRRA